MLDRVESHVWEVPLEEIDEGLVRFRVLSSCAISQMRRSLEHYGQIAPVVVFEHEGRLGLIDGFKRLHAARSLEDHDTLTARRIVCDAATAKAAIHVLNQIGGRTSELEEARIIRSLVREDGLAQDEVAALLGRHKSWVSRRLALLERLCEEGASALEAGVLSPTAARELLRLPHGNQAEMLEAIRRETLSSEETRRVVGLFLAAIDVEQRRFVVTQPREALEREEPGPTPYDPRLSSAGNRLAKRLRQQLDGSTRLEALLRTGGLAELSEHDRTLLCAPLERLATVSRDLVEAIEDFVRFGGRDGRADS